MGLARVAMAFQLPFVISVGLFAAMYDVQKQLGTYTVLQMFRQFGLFIM